MKLLKTTTYYFLLVLIVYIPFYRLFQGFVEAHFALSGSLSFWLAHWYEPVLAIFLLIHSLIFLLNWRKASKVQIILFLIILFSFLSVIFLSPTLSRGLEGFRFVILPISVFFLASQSLISKNGIQILVRIYLTIAFLASILAIVERFLPANYWALAGILNSNAPYWYGSHTVVGVKQSVSFIGGANELASFLLPAFFLVIGGIKKHSRFIIWYILFALIIFSVIFLTFSRSAIIGLIIALVVYLMVTGCKKTRIITVLSILSLIILSGAAYYFGGQGIKDLFTHGASQGQHSQALNLSLTELKNRFQDPIELIFGTGLGTAGPAAMKYGDGIISESWYLEILFSLGLIGLLMFLSLFFEVGKILIKKKNYAFFAGFLALLICSAFLHTLSDNPAITFTLFAIFGAAINQLKDDKIEKI